MNIGLIAVIAVPIAVASVAAALRQASTGTYAAAALAVIVALAGLALALFRSGKPLIIADYWVQVALLVVCPVAATFGVVRLKWVASGWRSAIVTGTLTFVVIVFLAATFGANIGWIRK